MTELFHDPGFWTFAASIVGAIRWLLRVFFSYKQRIDTQKAKLDVSVENIKKNNSVKTAESLRAIVNAIIPVVARHEEVVQNLERSVQTVRETEINLIKLIEPLNFQYAEFNRIVPNITTATNAVVDDIEKIKTEVIELKNGLIFIRTKKP